MERLVRHKSTGLNTTGIRTWGMVILVLAAAGKALLQNRLLRMTGGADLLAALEAEGGMIIASVALMLQALECCAAPIFSFLLVEGALHTADFGKYMARVLGLAVLTELPYNFAMTGSVLDLSDRNPVFAMALGLILLYFYRRYEAKSFGNTAIKLVVTAAAIVWGQMLGIQHGACCAILTAVFWAFRNKPNYRNLAGGTAAIVCSLISPFYLISPMGCMVLHFYNGEKGPSKQLHHYLVYPVSLLVIGLIGLLLG